MADETVGAAWYELGARDEGKLRRALGEAEGEIKRSGEKAERLFATPMERATGRVADGVDDIARSLNNLSGRSPKELADQLNRAEQEAEQALAAIKQISQNDDLSPKDAQRYADALHEIQVEADQTVADLRQLQQSDPRFDTDELNRAAQLIDKVGDEAKGTAGELERLSKGDTHLEGVSREARHAARDLEKAQGSAGKFGSSLGKLKGVITGLGVAFGLREAIAKMNEAVDAASGLEEAGSKAEQVFGDMTDDVRAWSKDSATAFGQSQRAALEAAGTYGNLLQAFGVARPAAAEMSKTLVELAADLASFNNTSVDEAIQALRSGLSGETEPLKRYGVALNDARLKEEALRLGLIKTATGTLPIAVKAQAAYALILKDTALAQGDFARTSDGYANQQRILAAELENVMAEIGQDLLPLWKELIGFMRDPGIPVIREVAGAITDLVRNTAKELDTLADAFRVAQIYFGDLGKQVEDRANEIGVDVGEMKNLVLKAMNDMGLGIDEAITYAEQRLAGLPYAMTDAGRQALAAWKQGDMAQLPSAVGETMGASAAAAGAAGVEDAIAAPFEEGADRAVEAVDSMYSRMAAVIAERENQLRQAGGDAVQAWLDPQIWANQAELVKGELVTANEELLEAQRNGTAAEVAEAQNRVLQLTAEALELQTNLATVGTDMEQLAKLSALRQSAFMLEGLSSEDEEIKRVFEAWAVELDEQIGHMEREVGRGGREIPTLLESGIEGGTGGVHGAIDNLTVKRPDTSWAYGVGAAIPSLIELGISENQWKAQSAMQGLAQVMKAPMVSSEPKDPSSALRGITRAWGMVDMIAAAIYRDLPTAKGASQALAAALAPEIDPAALDVMQAIPRQDAITRSLTAQAQQHQAPAPWELGAVSARNDGAGGEGRTQIFHLYFEGQQRTVDSPWAAVQEAQRMGAFES